MRDIKDYVVSTHHSGLIISRPEGQVTSLVSSSDVSARRWHHLAVVWDSENCDMELYVGGVLSIREPMESPCGDSLMHSALVTVGDYGNSGIRGN